MHHQEIYAHDLHRELTRRFARTVPETSLSVTGAGVNWRCTAQRGNLVCQIACYGIHGPEYYTSFEREAEKIATARIPSRDQTIAAVADWLDGSDLPSLYERYRFIDRDKRALTFIRDTVLATAPELKASASVQLKHEIADIYNLRLTADDRTCTISFYGKNELPDAKFYWDKCPLFGYRPDDNSQLAAVLKRWLCDHAQPSTMRLEFPWLEIGKLADYYENGKPVEGEFIQSWDGIEEFYRQGSFEFSGVVLAMIEDMREAGYDQRLRAGQSLSSLGLSRSRRHGLRANQPCIWFGFEREVMYVDADFVGVRLKEHPIVLDSEVRRLLDLLVAVEVA